MDVDSPGADNASRAVQPNNDPDAAAQQQQQQQPITDDPSTICVVEPSSTQPVSSHVRTLLLPCMSCTGDNARSGLSNTCRSNQPERPLAGHSGTK